MIKHILLIAAFLFPQASPIYASDFNERINDLIYKGIGLQISGNENDLIKRYGKPVNITVKEIQNKYYDFKDEVFIYEYPGMKVYYYKFNHKEHGWKVLNAISITSDIYELKFGLKVGLTLAQVESILGKADNISGNQRETTHFYLPRMEIGESEHEQLVLEFINGMLNEIYWKDNP